MSSMKADSETYSLSITIDWRRPYHAKSEHHKTTHGICRDKKRAGLSRMAVTVAVDGGLNPREDYHLRFRIVA
eukprot:4155042-Pleurochrysis_carterae.AAC.3